MESPASVRLTSPTRVSGSAGFFMLGANPIRGWLVSSTCPFSARCRNRRLNGVDDPQSQGAAPGGPGSQIWSPDGLNMRDAADRGWVSTEKGSDVSCCRATGTEGLLVRWAANGLPDVALRLPAVWRASQSKFVFHRAKRFQCLRCLVTLTGEARLNP